jgi:hypothetical protein
VQHFQRAAPRSGGLPCASRFMQRSARCTDDEGRPDARWESISRLQRASLRPAGDSECPFRVSRECDPGGGRSGNHGQAPEMPFVQRDYTIEDFGATNSDPTPLGFQPRHLHECEGIHIESPASRPWILCPSTTMRALPFHPASGVSSHQMRRC